MQHLLPASILAALLTSASQSAAAVVADYQFNTAGDTEGWVDRGIGSGSDNLVADGEVLTATSPGIDPQLKYDGTLERSVDAQWDTVTFRVRETESPGGEPIPFDPIGVIVQINNGVKNQGGITASKPDDFSYEKSDDGFYTVTVSIADFEDQTIDQLRIDPIGGALNNSNSDTPGNTYEIDFIQVTDTAPGSGPNQAMPTEPE